ncbi:fimbrial assembly protein [Burkholderia cepacia]|uniref:CS1 type fimbrial major subunit n=1 Tax=Burkholderia cepacia TaxID=292 RepID=UPI00249F666D|nr:CS1 type fimbrial major subunit [Burkholderia cepacia]WGY71348.1 fimbrial assembly protein [Burkholderia cepacia]
MKMKKISMVIGVAGALLGAMSGAQADSVQKKITLTATINDAMFVSKPDGSTWYGTEALDPSDYTQAKFSKKLPIRVWTKNPDFNVSLAQPLKLSNGRYEMANATVVMGGGAGDSEVKFGSVQTITQAVVGNGGYDEIHDVTINVDAPEQVGDVSTNGSYSGDLVMVFEPVAASGGN